MTIRTHNCGELNNNHIDKNVQLSGWVNSIRTHGQIIFIDIRDRFGKTQAILNSDELIEIGKTCQMKMLFIYPVKFLREQKT